MSDWAVIFLKWLPHEGIILTKYQAGRKYNTFWSMTFLVFTPVANFMHHPLGTPMHFYPSIVRHQNGDYNQMQQGPSRKNNGHLDVGVQPNDDDDDVRRLDRQRSLKNP